ncbi:flagellar hook-length control protein FliK [Rheinheimera sp.]|uniref:flagellar hook-length control protein FliK n=1 Tax=Rheinheimera sp. TaxID=1869214 RepID=UPI002736B851|nr:flagellar hook-length control protein FliK [Rheinheimera sp.]MDP2715608.1 flagellar hook-length control protein FliK [Rheinheimera sp.]
MAQGLQLSTLMSGADQALRFDAAAAEAGAESGGGNAFGELLSGMAPSTGDKASTPGGKMQSGAMRQLPAGISLLSGISQALAAAKAADAGTEPLTDDTGLPLGGQSGDIALEDADAETILLTASLLGQIALKDKVPADSDSKANDAQLSALLQTQSENTTTGADGETETNAETDGGIAATLSAKQQAAVSAVAEEAKPQSSATEADPDADAAQSAAATRAEPEADSAQSAADKAGNPAAILNAGAATADSAADTGTAAGAKAMPPELSANAVTEQSTQQPAQHSSQQSNDQSKAQDNEQSAGFNTAAQQQAAALKPEAVVGDKVKADAAVNPADKNNLTGKDAATAAGAEGGAKPQTGSGADKHNTEQQHQQRNPAAQAVTDSQLLAQDNNMALKAVPEQAGAQRSEAAFSHTLQAAEQRQQATLQKTAAKAPAEQLKQSLNLLQQDAAGQLRERVSLMVRQNIQVAEIRLDPAGLGQMQIKIDMQQDQASVQFIVQQPQAKELLEQQLPRLREMLQQQGIALSEGNVQQQTQQQQERQLARDNNSGGGAQQGAADEGGPMAGAVEVTAVVSERLVDYYA